MVRAILGDPNVSEPLTLSLGPQNLTLNPNPETLNQKVWGLGLRYECKS